MAENKNRSYLARDFVGFRNELLNHAKIYFSDNIQDFSEASLGGMFLEMAAYVGDTMSFYLDHQFNELDFERAVEAKNIQRHLAIAGIKVGGSSPASLQANFFIKVPSKFEPAISDFVVDESTLPCFKAGTTITTTPGIIFQLTHDVDFAEKDIDGNYIADIVSTNRRGGAPDSYILVLSGICVSGNTTTERFGIPNTDERFREIILSNSNVSSIMSVIDGDGNEYYEVESLSQDTVFKAVANENFHNDNVKLNLQVINAERRYVVETDVNSRKTTIRFGAGSPSSINDDIIPDPSEMALPLFGKSTLTKFSIDPNTILGSRSLGVYPKNTTIAVTYRHGGGANHNVAVRTARGVASLDSTFPPTCSIENRTRVINSIDVTNDKPAFGGADAPTINELRSRIPAARSMQNRIVTRQDLLARIYSLPSEFGRLYRASIINNPNNPLASVLHVVSRDKQGNLAQAPDSLKQNLSTYLNEFRLVSNALDVLDADIINFKIDLRIMVRPGVNATDVANAVINNLRTKFDRKNFEIGMPIVESEAINLILNTPGVMALDKLDFISQTGTILDRTYADTVYNFEANKSNGMFHIKQNSIFELKYPNDDITVNI